jgi:hypothetical protein
MAAAGATDVIWGRPSDSLRVGMSLLKLAHTELARRVSPLSLYPYNAAPRGLCAETLF